MNYPFNLSFYIKMTVSATLLTYVIVVRCSKLAAVSTAVFVQEFYQALRDKQNLSETDSPTSDDALTRNSICRDITASKFYRWADFVPVDIETIHRKQNHPKYESIFHQIYTRENTNSPYTYTNEYNLEKFNVVRMNGSDGTICHTEYMFICPIENSYTKKIVPIHVSREYNIGPAKGPYMPGRFIFGNILRMENSTYDYMALAEESGEIYAENGFSVDRHYLELRKYTESAKANDIDPLCKLVSMEALDPNNQHNRLCVAVSTPTTSEDDEVLFPDPFIVSSCAVKEVYWALTDDKGESTDIMLGYERMIPCFSTSNSIFLYISRGYRSNEAFVFHSNGSDEKVYLKNLITNLKIIDELNSFDFVEE